MSRPPGPDSPGSLGLRPGLSHDGRTDLGYATSKEKFHSPRPKANSFPYPEEVEDLEDRLLKKYLTKCQPRTNHQIVLSEGQ